MMYNSCFTVCNYRFCSTTISLSAYPQCTLSPMLNKITQLFLCSFKTTGFMVSLFTVCNITNNLISNKCCDKNIPNIYQIFHIHQTFIYQALRQYPQIFKFGMYVYISVRECIFLGMQKIFAQISSCFPNKV